MSKATTVVVIGRPNVGKSTLFNRLLGRRRALVHDEPGVTRDRLEERATWWVRGSKFPVKLVDTGGVGGDRFNEEITKQVGIALEEADVALMLFDGQVGLTDDDRALIRRLFRSGTKDRVKIIGVVNKVDADQHESMIADFFSAGLDPILTVSAEHGRGIQDLEEAIADAVGFVPEVAEDEEEPFEEEVEESDASEELDEESEEDEYAEVSDEDEDDYDREGMIKIAIVGRPNVGKSTFTNALLREDRMITSPIAGTTVDAVDSVATLGGREFLIIDTAGIRRKSKTEKGVEVLSVVQARKALERCDVAILMLDGKEGITDQDEKIGGIIEEIGCGVVICVNKWDTQRGHAGFTKEVASEILRKEMGFLKYAPILFTSAKERTGYRDLADLIEEIISQRRVKVTTHEFTEWVRRQSTVHNPANAKFFLCHQSGRHPPTFVCHVNNPDKIHFSLRRHLMNQLRERWGFMGSPVRLLFLEAQNRRSLPKKKKSAAKRPSAQD